MILKPDNPALAKAITIHPRSIRSPLDTTLLKSVSSNKKMGNGDNVISKGHWAGMPMYQLSLIERATCPSSCQQWDNCYGNNMAFAHRIDHAHPDFYPRLSDEVNLLTRKYRHGVVIRLHVLGDFFDENYVDFWHQYKVAHPNLNIFGFTAHTPDSPVGEAIHRLNQAGAWVRYSNAGSHPMAANVGTDHPGVTCPQQTGQTESCLTCALCWTTPRNINFLEH